MTTDKISWKTPMASSPMAEDTARENQTPMPLTNTEVTLIRRLLNRKRFFLLIRAPSPLGYEYAGMGETMRR